MSNGIKSALVLVVALAACYGAAALGGLATHGAVDAWYRELNKPSWTPPRWVFGPVWTVLYAMMAVAVWLVWMKGDGPARQAALAAFAVQLVLNAAWSPLFFGLHSPGLALLDIVGLWVAIAATVALFFHVRPLSGWLLVPYLLWVSFATALNLAIWRLNA